MQIHEDYGIKALEKLDSFFKKHVFMCTNTRPEGHIRGCCQEKEASSMRAYMREKVSQTNLERIRINTSGCLDRCEHGPVMVIYPEGIWYSPKSKEDLDEIIERHLINDQVVNRLLLPTEKE